MDEYSDQDLSRMRYYLPELKAKLAQNPNSLPLRNGIARIEEILGLTRTVEPICPVEFIDKQMELIRVERTGR